MTEAEWLTGTDFAAQVQFASTHLSHRRLRLLAVGFCRAASHLFREPYLEWTLNDIEQYADDLLPPVVLDRVRQRCRDIAQQSYEVYRTSVESGEADGFGASVRGDLAWAISFAANNPFPVDTVVGVGTRVAIALTQTCTGAVLLTPVSPLEYDAAVGEQMRLMRSVVWEVAGNPFRARQFSPEWRTDTAVALARQMYESREFSAMPILADALQDAGCDNEELLSHCRDTSAKHIRGCWVVDSVLRKE